MQDDPEPLTKTPPPGDLVLTTLDCPDANGREPEEGEHRYSLFFPLEDGRRLELHCGTETFNHFRSMILQLDADNAAERLLGG